MNPSGAVTAEKVRDDAREDDGRCQDDKVVDTQQDPRNAPVPEACSSVHGAGFDQYYRGWRSTVGDEARQTK